MIDNQSNVATVISSLYLNPLIATPAPDEPGTIQQQLDIIDRSIDLARSEKTTAADCWKRARAEVLRAR